MSPASTTPATIKYKRNAPNSQELSRNPISRIAPSDYGVELGSSPRYELLQDHPRDRTGQKLARKLCLGCRQHRAIFEFRGRVRFDRDHNLCPRCYRSAIDRLWASILG